MPLAVYGLAFLAGLMLNSSTIFIIVHRKERAIDLIWSFNLAFLDHIFLSFLPLRVWSMITNVDILLTLNSSITAAYMVSRAFFLVAMTACCTISVAIPAWVERPQAFKWAFMAALVIWALSFAFSVQYHDLWEAAMLSKISKIDLDTWTTMRPLYTSFLIWLLCLLTLMMTCYGILRSKQNQSYHTWSKEFLKRPYLFLITFFSCWLPYHVLYFLLVMRLDSPAQSSPGFVLGYQVAFILPYLGCCCNAIISLSTVQEFGSYLQQSGRQQDPQQAPTIGSPTFGDFGLGLLDLGQDIPGDLGVEPGEGEV